MNPVWIEKLIDKYKGDIDNLNKMIEDKQFDIDSRVRFGVKMHCLESVVRDLEVTLKEHA